MYDLKGCVAVCLQFKYLQRVHTYTYQMLKYLNDGVLSTTYVLIVVHMCTLFMISHCFLD